MAVSREGLGSRVRHRVSQFGRRIKLPKGARGKGYLSCKKGEKVPWKKGKKGKITEK